jgi:carboxylesterase type B
MKKGRVKGARKSATSVTKKRRLGEMSANTRCRIGPVELAQFPNNEDCFYLNVFTPTSITSSSKLPVTVWVHGGGFIAGGRNPYDGANLIGASGQKVIVVNFNYRLGAFFFSKMKRY